MRKGWGILAAAVSMSVMLAGISYADTAQEKDSIDAAETEVQTETAATEADTESEAELVRFDPDQVDGAYDISDDELVYAVISVEDYGDITLALDQTIAPESVANFVALAEDGFYDGLTFHRIIEDFMMQGGDPTGTGTGGSDTSIKGEFEDNGVENPITHVRGTISMARTQDYDSATSQFFITQADCTYLDGQYAAFGYVTDGMDVVDAICEDASPTDNNGSIAQDEQPVMTSVRILES